MSKHLSKGITVSGSTSGAIPQVVDVDPTGWTIGTVDISDQDSDVMEKDYDIPELQPLKLKVHWDPAFSQSYSRASETWTVALPGDKTETFTGRITNYTRSGARGNVITADLEITPDGAEASL